MVHLRTSEEWHRQSALLLQARPTTTRITTKYKIPNLNSPKYQQTKKRKRDGEDEEKETSVPKVPRAVLVLKTYDPQSGVVLKFKTDRAAEVGRLISGLGKLGRHMAALPEKSEGIEDATSTTERISAEDGTALTRDAESSVVSGQKPQTQQQQAANSGKKKKKGKK
ncbi:hypothetical protein M433DRAFT_76129 [Acidomyces richmondensis BFW]|nr:hypothetical protein M433DRAFT_76129 [Acidomyces richmondensis BFW]